MTSDDHFSRRALLETMIVAPSALGGATRADAASAFQQAGSTGADRFRQGGRSAVGRTVADKLRERVTPLDFGARGDANPRTGAGTDDSEAVQAAIDYCAANAGTSLYLAGRFYKILNVRLTQTSDNRRWRVFGEGGGFVHPANSSSRDFCLFYSGLPEPGSDRRSLDSGPGVGLYQVTFAGTGHGVGYGHLVASDLITFDCTFRRLEDGFVCVATTGIKNYGITLDSCARGAHFAATTEVPFTANFSQDGSTKWNDGVYFQGGYMRNCGRGILHEGSNSEGLLVVRDMVMIGGYQAYVETWADMQGVEIEHNWIEYTRADEDGGAVADLFRFLAASGRKGDLRGAEAIGRFIVRNNVFALSPPRAGGANRYAIDYCIWARCRDLLVEGNLIHAARGAVYTGFVFQMGASSPVAVDSATGVRPRSVADFASAGEIVFDGADIDALGSRYSFFYMTDEGDQDRPKATWLLQYKGARGRDYVYTVHRFSHVYSPQFPMHNANFGTSVGESRPLRRFIAPTGISVDLSAPTTGLTFTGPTVTLSPGINGGLLFDGEASRRGLCVIRGNAFVGFDMTRIVQLPNQFAGRVILENNRNAR